jgi:hypothetical protein
MGHVVAPDLTEKDCKTGFNPDVMAAGFITAVPA